MDLWIIVACAMIGDVARVTLHALLVLGAILLQIFGLRMHHLDTCASRKFDKIVRKTPHLSSQVRHKFGLQTSDGLIISRRFVAFRVTSENQHSDNVIDTYIMCTCSISDALMRPKQPKPGHVIVPTYIMSGEYGNIYAKCKKLNFPQITPRASQQRIIDDIKNFKGASIVYIYGKPGMGKTTIGELLVQQMERAALCINFNPTTPGHSLDKLEMAKSYNLDKRIVIMLNEFDQKILRALNGEIKQNPKYDHVIDKSGLTGFFDAVRKYEDYKYIVIITSNTPPDVINARDKSILNSCRFTGIYHLDD